MKITGKRRKKRKEKREKKQKSKTTKQETKYKNKTKTHPETNNKNKPKAKTKILAPETTIGTVTGKLQFHDPDEHIWEKDQQQRQERMTDAEALREQYAPRR